MWFLATSENMAESIQVGKLVTPGDELGSEEEFLPSTNVIVDQGYLFSTITGKVKIENGEISVQDTEKSIRKIMRGDIIIGTVVGELKSVLFIKIDSVKISGKKFVPSKDGKIVMMVKRERFPPRRETQENKDDEDSGKKPCTLGDSILAKVSREEEDIYVLNLFADELGVIYSFCDLCSGELKYNEGKLFCNACEKEVRKKVSTLYDDALGIDNYLKANLNF
jgi:exosome complex component CSL4